METFLQAFITMFVIVDPLGTASVFAVLTRGMDGREASRIALKASLIAVCLLLGFGLLGGGLLRELGISLPAFRVAGGLLLFVTAFRMLMGFHDPDHLNSEKTVYRDKTDIAIFPLAIPFLAGPGCMTAAMLLMTASSLAADKALVGLAIALVSAAGFLSMLGAARLARLFGPSGGSLLARIMGVLLAAMAVQFVADGIRALMAG